MKKMFLALAILFSSFAVHAQQKLTPEEARFICAEMMANFTLSLGDIIQQGSTFEEFEASLLGKAEPSKEGRAQLEAAYRFLSKGTTKDEILKTYDGKEIAGSLQFLANLHAKGSYSGGSDLFGIDSNSEYGKEGCKWYQFWCHVQEFANWVVENWQTIQQIIVFIIEHL